MRAALSHNFGLKVVSFLISLAIWYRVSFISTVTITQSYLRPIQLVNLDPSLSVAAPLSVKKAEVKLSGRRIDLIQAESQLEVVVDLKNVKSPIGDVTALVDAVIPAALHLQVVKVEPSQV